MPSLPTPTQAARAGFRETVVLTIGVIPFGLAYGAAVREAGFDPWLGALASPIVMAGAAQLSLVDLIESGAHWAVAIGTAWIINARFVLYSAAFAPAFSEFGRRWRFGLPYMLSDQAAAMSLLYFANQTDPRARRWYFLGSGLTLVAGWYLSTTTGIVAGSTIPDSLEVAFGIPLMFLAMLVPTIRDRPMLVSALVAAAVTTAGMAMPSGTNVLLGALVGVTVGVVLDR